MIPATNKAYLHLAELQNFQKAAQSAMGLPPGAGVNAAMERLQARFCTFFYVAAFDDCMFSNGQTEPKEEQHAV